MLGIDRDLRVVADRDARVRCHRAAVGIAQRDLALAAAIEALQDGAQTIALGANCIDFRGEVRHTRATARAALLDVTGVQLP